MEKKIIIPASLERRMDPFDRTSELHTQGLSNDEISKEAMRDLLLDLDLPSSIRRTNRRGEKMTIGGKTWTRRHDVHHVVVMGFNRVRKFRDEVGFWNPRKAVKLADLVELENMPPAARYGWFVSHYEKRGRKWVKNEQRA